MKKKILLVDDDVDLLFFMRYRLESFRRAPFADGRAAVGRVPMDIAIPLQRLLRSKRKRGILPNHYQPET